MFYYGSEVIVIGSNVKRKSGPRVGSIGNILHIDSHTYNFNTGTKVVGASVVFNRFGYEKRRRCEVVHVQCHRHGNALLATSGVKGTNSVSKLITLTKSHPEIVKISNVVVLAPLLTFSDIRTTCKVKNDANYAKIVPYIATCLQSAYIQQVMLSAIFRCKESHYSLRKLINANTVMILKRLYSLNLLDKQATLYELLEKDYKEFSKILLFLDTIKSLAIRRDSIISEESKVSKLLYNKRHLLEDLYNNLFKSKEYKKLKAFAKMKEVDIRIVEELKTALVKKGNITYTSH